MEINVHYVSIHAKIANNLYYVYLAKMVIFYLVINVYSVCHHVKLAYLLVFVYHVKTI